MWLLKPLPIRLPFVGSRSAGFFPSPAVRLDFRFQFASRGGESTLHLFKERKVDCFFPSQLSPVVSNISTTCSLDFGNSCALRPLYFARSVCVWTGFRWRNTLDMCLHRVWRIISMWALFSENNGWTRFLLNAVLHYIACAVDDVDAICPNFQDETGTTCFIFTWLPRNLSRFNLRPCI